MRFTTKLRPKGHSPHAAIAMLGLTLLTLLLLAAPALAKKPSEPASINPRLRTAMARPTFEWLKTAGAARYEVCAYKGTTLLVKKTGITKLSWTSSKVMPKGVNLTWKVRGVNASGSGPWSQSCKFKVVTVLDINVFYNGGRIAYLYQQGDPGYVAGEKHGLIVSQLNQSTGIRWDNGAHVYAGATETGLGWGLYNSNTIVYVLGSPQSAYAAGLARAYKGGGFTDWFLPSVGELQKLCIHHDAIGGYLGYSWSSSEYATGGAYMMSVLSGQVIGTNKDQRASVRAVREF